MQLDTTARSLVNSLETAPGKHSITPVNTPVTTRQSKIESFRPDFVRSSSRAPTFCAVNADSAERKAMGISIPKPIMRSTTPTAADWVSPMWLTMAVIMTKERFTSTSCAARGMPRRSTCPMIAGCAFRGLQENGNGNVPRRRDSRARIQATA